MVLHSKENYDLESRTVQGQYENGVRKGILAVENGVALAYITDRLEEV